LVGFFFQDARKKNADLIKTKKKVNMNYKGQLPLSKQKIFTNQADLKKKSHDGGGDPPPIALFHLVMASPNPNLGISNIESLLKFISEMMLLNQKLKCF
jgi:hypothetical protein